MSKFEGVILNSLMVKQFENNGNDENNLFCQSAFADLFF